MRDNEFLRQESKEEHVLAFKHLCHQLNEQSHSFMKGAVEGMSPPLQKFVKEQVYFFEG